MLDQYNRDIDYLRISITDRCNLRCIYCMPEEGVHCCSHDEILTYEEIERLTVCLAMLGIKKIKLTGGEPLIRKGVVELVRYLKRIPGIDQVTMTTNGVLLAGLLPELQDAGLDGVNISLDTTSELQFHQITRNNGSEIVVDSIKKALECHIKSVKVNCVIMKGINESEIIPLATLAKELPVHVRYIEMMPIGYGSQYGGISQEHIRKILEEKWGRMELETESLGNGPAVYYKIKGFQGRIGFVSAMTHQFCQFCNRIRLTSDGILKPCLQYESDVDMKKLLRMGATDEQLIKEMEAAVYRKPRQHEFGQCRSDAEKEQRVMARIGG